MPIRECAWATTGRPARCAVSTIVASSGTLNWAPSWSVPGVANPPEAMTLTTSTPRPARSATAARTSVTSPPRKWQWPPGVVIGGPDGTTRGSPGDARNASVR